MKDPTKSAIANLFTDTVEGMATLAGDVFRTALPNYCEIETADSPHTLVSHEGWLLSGLRVNGMLRAVGSAEFEDTVSRLNMALASYLREQGHNLQLFFTFDPAGVRRTLEEAAAGSYATAQRLELEVDDVLHSRVEHLSSFCADESMYIAMWTSPLMLSSQERKAAGARRTEAVRNSVPIPATGQDIWALVPEIREKHEGFVQTAESDLNKAGFLCDRLSAHEMLTVARHTLDAGFTPTDWRPALPGDPVPRMMRGKGDRVEFDFSDIQLPRIEDQLFPRDARRVNARYVECGDLVFAPMFIEIPPRTILPFSALFEKLQNSGAPWRIAFALDGGGVKYVGSKGALASLLSWASPYNRMLKDAVNEMKNAAVTGEAVVRLRITLCTWAPAGDLDTLRARASRLANSVASWGQAEVREVSGDPMEGLASTVPFLRNKSSATAAIAPLIEIARMLPLMRPASPWRQGGILYRTIDGKLMPMQPGSSMQNTWNYILIGRPGSGKSLQMLSILFGSCLAPGIKGLPRMAIIDIGDSSKGLIQLIRDALPTRNKHHATHFRLRMSPEYAINPFDTQLGCRYPTAEHRAFLVNVLTQVATPPELTDAYPSMSQMVSKLVDMLYLNCADEPRSDPKRYARAVCPAVDEMLDRYPLDINRNTLWWEVVDFLFQQGHIHEATLAQRYAVPLLADAPGMAMTRSIEDLYGAVTIETGESLNQAFARLTQDALRDYSILAEPTRFDIGDTRIAAMNLEEVAKSGSRSADRQTAIMYLLARFAMSKDFRLTPDVLASVPEAYRPYHAKRVAEMRETMKWVSYDEFHRTAASHAVRNDVLVDMKEGRKYNIGVVLASQNMLDFPENIREESTGVFMFDGNANPDRLQQLFGFNATARSLLTTYVNGPTARGAPFLVHMSTKVGTFTQLLYSTVGSVELWAFSTTMEDILIRERVAEVVGHAEGRRLLAERFPGGSAKALVEELRANMSQSSSDEARGDAIQTVVTRVLEGARKGAGGATAAHGWTK